MKSKAELIEVTKAARSKLKERVSFRSTIAIARCVEQIEGAAANGHGYVVVSIGWDDDTIGERYWVAKEVIAYFEKNNPGLRPEVTSHSREVMFSWA